VLNSLDAFEEFVLTRDFVSVPALWNGVDFGLMWPADLSKKDVQRMLERWKDYALHEKLRHESFEVEVGRLKGENKKKTDIK